MKPIFREKTNAGVGKPALRGVLAACCLGVAMGANAAIDDEPYWQLFPGAPLTDAKGSDTSVSICGTTDCTDTSQYMVVSVITEDQNPAGTGFINSFLRLNEPGTENGANPQPETDGSTPTTESGYNTDFPVLQDSPEFVNDAQDQPGAGNDWNRAVLLSDLLISPDGYYEILLDLNEQGTGSGNSYIKLDEFEIHLSDSGTLSFYDDEAMMAGTADGYFADTPDYLGKVFDMDYWRDLEPVGGLPNDVEGYGGLILESCADKNNPNSTNTGGCGSGDKDYLFRLPVSLFPPDTDGVYMHLVATLGEGTINSQGEFDPVAIADAGYDEFAAVACVERNFKGEAGDTVDCGGQVPVPGTAWLFGLGFLALYGRRKSFV